MLNISLIKEKTRDIISPENIFYYETADSTNTRALEYAKELGKNAPERAVFIADGQTLGRGRRGRSFVSEAGAGIYITFLYTPKKDTDAERITARSAVALRRAIKKSTDTDTKIKWVNDLYASLPTEESKKLSGILAEAVTEDGGKIARIAVGMGINVYKSSALDEISDIATSLEDVTGKRFSREEIIFSLIWEFYKEREERDVLAEYRDSSLTLGRSVTVFPHSGESYDALVKEILDDYSLLVKTERGEEKRIFSGEVRTKIRGKGNLS